MSSAQIDTRPFIAIPPETSCWRVENPWQRNSWSIINVMGWLAPLNAFFGLLTICGALIDCWSTKKVSRVELVSKDSKLYLALLNAIQTQKGIKQLDLTGCSFETEAFKTLIDTLTEHPTIKEIIFTKALLSEVQITEVQILGSLRKLKILDSAGTKFGAAYLNWHDYNVAKSRSYLRGMRETTSIALDHLKKDTGRLPNFVLDFGAGTGSDTIPLIALGCQKVWAVDADEEACKTLKSNLGALDTQISEQLVSRVTCILSEFIKLKVDEPVELLVSSFTWPYRPPKAFPDCWKKCVDIVPIGGYICGQFFGPPKTIDPGMTYHQESELKEMLSKNFKVVWFKKEPEGSIVKVYGGDTPAWGDLYHVVAKKVSN